MPIKPTTLLSKISIVVFIFFSTIYGSTGQETEPLGLAPTPLIGWNSYDSYGIYLHEKAAFENLEAMAVKLKPRGYQYFVVDAGWYYEFKLKEGTLFPMERVSKKVSINKYGLLQPSKVYFPNGLQQIIDRCHELGLKFGIHLMRGIPRFAVERNLPIEETKYFASNIADTVNICTWSPLNYGVDMDKPGAQEYYNSVINQMAKWKVDFIKYDDIVPFPKEVDAVIKAIAQCGRPIVLSLSPGGKVDKAHISSFKNANMLRVTADIWDDKTSIDSILTAWRKWQGFSEPNFWIDMDMIPFGKLQVMAPNQRISSEDTNKNKNNRKPTRNELLAGKGSTRWSKFTKNQKRTFITILSMAASPLMLGGDLPTLDEYSLSLVTNNDMLECNQNGVMGKLMYENEGVEIWNTKQKNSKNGWIAILNRTPENVNLQFTLNQLGLDINASYQFRNIWGNVKINSLNNINVMPWDVVFIRYQL
ncbi:MAG: glycoside hydrolase family 27 protein [Draconibacterium sp.]|nr:glycoside hydrolase family 27 protein [Draconibacterium sp.]